MAYNAKISIGSPQAIVVLIDQSGSMSEITRWRDNAMTKASAVAEVVNGCLSELVARCNHYGNLRHYFDIAVLGYGGHGIRSLLPSTSGSDFVSPAGLASADVRSMEIINTRMMDERPIVTRFTQKVWVEALADGQTPMNGAITRACELLSTWIAAHNDTTCFPPLVINITDGEATDADPATLAKSAERLRCLTTRDGAALLVNVHIEASSDCSAIAFPTDGASPMTKPSAAALFEMSSVMPEIFNDEIAEMTPSPGPYRAFAYNASITDLLRILNISSSTAPISK